MFVCFDLILYVTVNNFFSYAGTGHSGFISSKQGLMCLAQGHNACADPGILVRGVQVRLTKKALTTFLFFFSPQLILQKSNGQFQRNLSFLKVPEGVQHFQGGGSNFFQGRGSNCLFPLETHITCDFPGGPDPLSPPLDPHWQCSAADEAQTRNPSISNQALYHWALPF